MNLSTSHLHWLESFKSHLVPLTEESREKIAETLFKIPTPQQQFEDQDDFLNWIGESIPCMQWTIQETYPSSLSIYFLFKPSKDISLDEFLLDYLRKWILPDKHLRLFSFCSHPFRLNGQGEFTVLEAHFFVHEQSTAKLLQDTLPSLQKEITFLLNFPSFCKDFLELKIVTYPDRPVLLLNKLTEISKKHHKKLESDLFSEMGRFLVLSSAEFKKRRSSHTVLRIIFSHDLLKKKILKEVRLFPEKRQLSVRLLSSELMFPFGNKTVLGLAIVLHLPDPYEYFDEQHILLAIQQLSSLMQIVQGSFYASQTSHDTVRSLYVEIEKRDGTDFTLQERKLIQAHLEEKLKERIEKLSPSIFMMGNAEEVMKNIFMLSGELNSPFDIPQVIISLEKQTTTDLYFTIVLVRSRKPSDPSLQHYFANIEDDITFLPEKEQVVGYLPMDRVKEACVFQLKIPRFPFTRCDSSTNFYLARKKILTLLTQVLGEVRDYNGGMLLKQGEVLSQLKINLPFVSAELLENLFYSITPIEMQAILPFPVLQDFLTAALEMTQKELPKRESYGCSMQQKEGYSFAILRANDFSLKGCIEEALRKNTAVVSFSISYQESLLIGYLYTSHDLQNQMSFCTAIREGIEEWNKKIKKLRVLRLHFNDWSYSLDPRMGGDTVSSIILKGLFEGLTRRGKDGTLALAAAERVEVSDDLKHYTFHLRKSFWSNGDPVLAHDFEYAWKKILSPHFNTSFAYHFYPIKNAAAVKKGQLPIDQLGISCLNEATLRVELEEPCSYFLELLSHAIFSPVNHRVDQKHPNWFTREGEAYICNGPFYLLKSHPHWGRYELAKNPRYWDAGEVELDKIILLKADIPTALEMYKRDEIDWIGRPASPWDGSYSSSCNETVHISSTYTVYWYVFNVQRYPFHNKNLRKAIHHLIDRKELLDTYGGIGTPAVTPLPISHTQHSHLPIPKSSPELALAYFEKALEELHLQREQFPPIGLMCPTGGTRYQMAQAIKKKIEETLQIPCYIETYPWGVLFEKMTQGEHHIGAMGWTALVDDPLYTLNAFKHVHERINFSKWEHPRYKELLDSANRELDPQKRRHIIGESEALLIEEVPLMPFYYEMQQYAKKSHVKLPANWEVKDIDFKWISMV